MQYFGWKTWKEGIIQQTWKYMEGNIGMGLRETGWEIVDWIQLAQDRDRWRSIVNTVP